MTVLNFYESWRLNGRENNKFLIDKLSVDYTDFLTILHFKLQTGQRDTDLKLGEIFGQPKNAFQVSLLQLVVIDQITLIMILILVKLLRYRHGIKISNVFRRSPNAMLQIWKGQGKNIQEQKKKKTSSTLLSWPL